MIKTIKLLSRYFLAVVFLFSGFVKGVDPLGTAYKIEDYFIAYQMEWALPFSLGVSFLLIALELSLGAFLILQLLPKFTRWASAILMLFFTAVTLYDAIYNPVPNCGCFGDALILTNWETFYKNIVLDLCIIPLFIATKRNFRIQHIIIAFILYFGALGFSYYNLQHLPIIDFRFWKVGTQVYNTDQQDTKIYLLYRNSSTGETQEFISPNFPYQDSVWVANWEFVSSREVAPQQLQKSLMIFDQEGEDATAEILGVPEMSLLLISNNLRDINEKQSAKIKILIQITEDKSIPLFLITATVGKTATEFKDKYHIDLPLFLADDIDLKTIIRSNPGLIQINQGKVINKWAVSDFPDSYNDLIK